MGKCLSSHYSHDVYARMCAFLSNLFHLWTSTELLLFFVFTGKDLYIWQAELHTDKRKEREVGREGRVRERLVLSQLNCSEIFSSFLLVVTWFCWWFALQCRNFLAWGNPTFPQFCFNCLCFCGHLQEAFAYICVLQVLLSSNSGKSHHTNWSFLNLKQFFNKV